MSKGIDPRRVIEYFKTTDVEIAGAILNICTEWVKQRKGEVKSLSSNKPVQRRLRKPKANGAAGATSVPAPTPALSFPPQES
jgi:ribosome-binding protein aMBF1 (putative translation factor)